MSYSKRLVTLVAVSFLVGACGSSATPAPPTAPPAASTAPTSSGAAGGSASPGAGDTGPGPESGTVALTLSSGYSEMDPVYKKAADAYHALHPNVTITVSSTDLRSYEQKLTIALPTKTSTDIVEHSLAFLTPFVDQNLLAPVPAWMQTFVTSGVFDKFVQSHVTYKGQVWGVPGIRQRGRPLLQQGLAERGRRPATDHDGPDHGRRAAAHEVRRQRRSQPVGPELPPQRPGQWRGREVLALADAVRHAPGAARTAGPEQRRQVQRELRQ